MSTGDPLQLIGKTIHAHHVERYIGPGGMSYVYLVSPIRGKSEQFAMKIMMKDEKFRQLFEREKTLLAKLNHKHIVSVYDIEPISSSDHEEQSNLPFIVMVFARYGSLYDHFINQNDITYGQACTIIGQIVQALEYLHGMNIFHADVKPPNILLSELDVALLTDFGLAVDRENDNVSVSLPKAGTQVYMPYEQIKNGTINQYTDQFALGVTAYWLFTGLFPFPPVDKGSFTDEDHREAIAESRRNSVTPPKELNSELPDEINQAIMTALAFNPEERHRLLYNLEAQLKNAIEHHRPNAEEFKNTKISRKERATTKTIPISSQPLNEGYMVPPESVPRSNLVAIASLLIISIVIIVIIVIIGFNGFSSVIIDETNTASPEPTNIETIVAINTSPVVTAIPTITATSPVVATVSITVTPSISPVTATPQSPQPLPTLLKELEEQEYSPFNCSIFKITYDELKEIIDNPASESTPFPMLENIFDQQTGSVQRVYTNCEDEGFPEDFAISLSAIQNMRTEIKKIILELASE